MSGKHTAENIGTAIENMQNKFVFNKPKIHGLWIKIYIYKFKNLNIIFWFKGIACDERSSLVRLFSHLICEEIQNLSLEEMRSENIIWYYSI